MSIKEMSAIVSPIYHVGRRIVNIGPVVLWAEKSPQRRDCLLFPSPDHLYRHRVLYLQSEQVGSQGRNLVEHITRQLSGIHVTRTQLGEKEMSVGEYLSSIYYEPRKAGSFSGPKALYKAVRADGKRILSMKKIKDWLKSQDVYTMHRKTIHKFKRNRVYVEKMDAMWDVDLMDMMAYAKENGEVRYVLVAIDVFSRYAWTVPLKSKKAGMSRKDWISCSRKLKEENL